MTRWKCPDCGGWVADILPIHFCAPPEPATSTKMYPNTVIYPGTAGNPSIPTYPGVAQHG